MSLQLGKRFWIAATAGIFILMAMVVGRNAVHAVKIKRQINALAREQSYFRDRIGQDSTLLEHLRYNDYLEEFARENFQMQRRDEYVYMLKE